MRLNVEASCFCVHVLDRCGQVSLWSDHYYAWVGVFRCLWSDQYYALSWGGQVSVKWSVLCPELGWSGVCEVISTVPWVGVVRCLWSDRYCAPSWGGQVSVKWSVPRSLPTAQPGGSSERKTHKRLMMWGLMSSDVGLTNSSKEPLF